ncbi:MAG: PH domain-containing protein [Dermatophilaceae bacterium]
MSRGYVEREARPPWLDRYLRPGEQDVVTTRRHGVAILEPWLSVAVGLAIVLIVGMRSPSNAGLPLVTEVLWWCWFLLLGRAVLITYDWRRTWFVATNNRLLLVHGFVIRKVAMMPLGKVTDMTYERSVLGRLLGFGTFVLESAGQDQALRVMDHIPKPDDAYRAIIAQIFPSDDVDEIDGDDDDDDDLTPCRTRGRHGPGGPRESRGERRWGMRRRVGGTALGTFATLRRLILSTPPDPYRGTPRPALAHRPSRVSGMGSIAGPTTARPGGASTPRDHNRHDGSVEEGTYTGGEVIYSSWPDDRPQFGDGYGPEGPPTDPLGFRN